MSHEIRNTDGHPPSEEHKTNNQWVNKEKYLLVFYFYCNRFGTGFKQSYSTSIANPTLN